MVVSADNGGAPCAGSNYPLYLSFNNCQVSEIGFVLVLDVM